MCGLQASCLNALSANFLICEKGSQYLVHRTAMFKSIQSMAELMPPQGAATTQHKLTVARIAGPSAVRLSNFKR